jgi:NAD(P)-dependent dehydrogenase (short-subunit alcohol dehydrogenase family)
MIERGYGKIINISSASARWDWRIPVSTAQPSRVMAFTKSLAKEVIGKGINVNSISPGLAIRASCVPAIF